MTDQQTERGRRYEYEMVKYGDAVLDDSEYADLETAIDEMAADGWRFVQALDDALLAVFEREVPQECPSAEDSQ